MLRDARPRRARWRGRILIIAILVALGLLGPAPTHRRAGAAGEWQPAGTLAVPHQYQATALLHDGSVLVTGGAGREPGAPPGSPFVNAIAAAERYDPATNRWALAAPMLRVRVYHSATTLPDGTVLVVGGHGVTGGGAEADTPTSAERYDPATDRWVAVPGPHADRVEHTATLLPDGRVLVVGGIGVRGARELGAELLDPGTGVWRVTAPLPVVPLSRHAATLLADGTVLVTGGTAPSPANCQGGGCTGSAMTTTLRYDPTTDRWTTVAPMGIARGGHTATLLADGTVLVVGGGQAERYDPRADRWTATAPQPARHASEHTATLLPDGTVLVVGGGDRSGTPYTTAADRYDPAADRWVAAGTMQSARNRHTATRLLDGRVLVVGGYGPVNNTAEIFGDPALQPAACFAETDHCLSGRFLAYWREHGGLAINGYPLSGEFDEVLEDGKPYRVQYFERVRMEYHPENPAPYDVLLGQFGRRILAESYVVDRRAYDGAIAPREPLPGQVFFAETEHNLDGAFLDYWRANGGLVQFGFPLTDERFDALEDGQVYRTQYFERARFEYHPEHAGTPYAVLLGQFGRRVMAENQQLTGDLGVYFQTHERAQVRLGNPVSAPLRSSGSTLAFEQGRMIWAQQAPAPHRVGGGFLDLYASAQLPIQLLDENAPAAAVPTIFVLCGDQDKGEVGLVRYRNGYGFITDTWREGDPSGDGPGPRPGLSRPGRGFGKVWSDERYSRCTGYATEVSETVTATTVQYFRGGALVLVETPSARALYLIAIGSYTNSGPPHAVYERVALPAR